MIEQERSLTSGINFKDKVGYALGDTGGVLIFGVVGAFLQMFYTDVLYIDLSKILVLLVVTRIWDTINDPIWGAIIDARKPSKHGKFRPYLIWVSFPLAIAGVLMFTKIPGLSEDQYLLYAYITYIFYDMMFTGVNIPYGSLASVITDDEIERSSLSVFRSIGSGLGGLPGQILLPLFVYSTIESTGAKYLDSNKLTTAVAILAVCCVVCFYLSFKMTKERVVSPPIPPKTDIPGTLKILIRNKSFVALSIASMLLISSQVYTQTLFNYLFKDYFSNPKLFSMFAVATYAPMIILIPFMSKLVKIFGKKELCAAGLALSTVSTFALWVFKVQSPYTFLGFCLVIGFGLTFFILEVWALAMDVIDYQEYLAKRREEGTIYALFSFTRKLGQSVAAGLGVFVLSLIAYDAKAITAVTISKMYTMSTIVPAFMYLAAFISLAIFYPLGKTKLKQLHENEYTIHNYTS